jgi:hypothetical protein
MTVLKNEAGPGNYKILFGDGAEAKLDGRDICVSANNAARGDPGTLLLSGIINQIS